LRPEKIVFKDKVKHITPKLTITQKEPTKKDTRNEDHYFKGL